MSCSFLELVLHYYCFIRLARGRVMFVVIILRCILCIILPSRPEYYSCTQE